MRSYRVDYPPTAKGRPRAFALPGRGTRLYTPDTTLAAERAIALLVKAQQPPPVPSEPLVVSMIFAVQRPKRPRPGFAFPVGRPDVDNYAKLVMDALNGILWADDAQIVLLSAAKVYAERPFIEIEVRSLREDD